jgi:hypothetical protein
MKSVERLVVVMVVDVNQRERERDTASDISANKALIKQHSSKKTRLWIRPGRVDLSKQEIPS